MMKITVHVCCDACEGIHDTPFEDHEFDVNEPLGDEHETSGLVYVDNYEGSGTLWLCPDCYAEHLDDLELLRELEDV